MTGASAATRTAPSLGLAKIAIARSDWSGSSGPWGARLWRVSAGRSTQSRAAGLPARRGIPSRPTLLDWRAVLAHPGFTLLMTCDGAAHFRHTKYACNARARFRLPGLHHLL